MHTVKITKGHGFIRCPECGKYYSDKDMPSLEFLADSAVFQIWGPCGHSLIWIEIEEI